MNRKVKYILSLYKEKEYLKQKNFEYSFCFLEGLHDRNNIFKRNGKGKRNN